MATTMTLLQSLPFGSSLPLKSLSDLRSISRNLSPSMAASMEATSEQIEEKTTRKKVFVAGSTGRTGRKIVEQLLSPGYGVRAGALDLDKARSSLPMDSNVEFVRADVTGGSEQLAEAIGDVDAVICATGFLYSWDIFAPWKITIKEECSKESKG